MANAIKYFPEIPILLPGITGMSEITFGAIDGTPKKDEPFIHPLFRAHPPGNFSMYISFPAGPEDRLRIEHGAELESVLKSALSSRLSPQGRLLVPQWYVAGEDQTDNLVSLEKASPFLPIDTERTRKLLNLLSHYTKHILTGRPFDTV